MAVKSGSCGKEINPLTGAVTDNTLLFVPAIGERGRITIGDSFGSAGYLAYEYLNSTTLGDFFNGYTNVVHTNYSCVFDYIRMGNGVTVLTYVSGNAGALMDTAGYTEGGIYLEANLDDFAFPAPPYDFGAPYTDDGDGLVFDSKNPNSGSYKSAGAASWSADYTVFSAFWAKGSNRIAGDEVNNV